MALISPEQVRAARAILGLSEADLAKAARVPIEAVRRAEGSGRSVAAADAVEKIAAALEKAGITFLADEGDGPGLRVKKRRRMRQSIPVEELTAENDE